jgi:hypothetical protein
MLYAEPNLNKGMSLTDRTKSLRDCVACSEKTIDVFPPSQRHAASFASVHKPKDEPWVLLTRLSEEAACSISVGSNRLQLLDPLRGSNGSFRIFY